VSNLQNISDSAALVRQHNFFSYYKYLLLGVNPDELTQGDLLNYKVMLYEVNINLERIEIERRWIASNSTIQGEGIFSEAMGSVLYPYFLKKWVDASVSPNQLYEFGISEVLKIKDQMSSLRDSINVSHGTSDSLFYLKSDSAILAEYGQIQKNVIANAPNYFPYINTIDDIRIERGTNEDLAIVPAYYNEGTFYYNNFSNKYDSREMGWIYLHEAIPGHHYQGNIHGSENFGVRNTFWYMGYSEGWGAYVEQYGYELGAFRFVEDKYKQLNWDLIRSARVAMDVGINYKGWTDKQALDFWKEHIKGQDEIGLREIARMKRWPAQVATYKYGKSVFDQIKNRTSSTEELKMYHKKILDLGPLPLSLLEEQIQQL
jgi:uncharacterized protein (DUF885 family)